MSIEFKLTNDNLISYARTDDAVEAFNASAANGQLRLGIEVLVDVINGIVEKLEELELKIENLTSSISQVPSKADSEVKPKTSKSAQNDKEVNSIEE